MKHEAKQMNEQAWIEIFKASPFLAFCGWMVWQMKQAIDRMMERNEQTAKVVAAALDKSTEMMGRGIQSATQTEAQLARTIDIIQDYTDEKRRSHGGGS